jgi:multiple sugar transport system permease protein
MSSQTEVGNRPQKKKYTFNSAILLGLPYMVFMFVFGIVPVILALIFSFSKYGGYQPEYFQAGLSNYVSIFKDPQLLVSFGNIFKFAAISLPISFLGALGIALVLNLADDGIGRVMRTTYFIPGAITLSAVALIAVFMFDPGASPFGFIFEFINQFRPPDDQLKTAGDILNNRTLIPFLVIVRFFALAGGWIAIFYGALTGINREIIEAGMIDGCSPWTLAWHIKRPLIMGYVFFMLITLSIQSLQLFAEPFILSTALLTASPIDPYWSPNMWSSFITVRTGDFGKSAVISLIMLLLSLVAAVIIVTRTGFFKTEVARK